MENNIMATLIENLNAIKQCKADIKQALIDKSGDKTYMEGYDFSKYADRIRSLKVSSGDSGESDEPSVPTPSVDYIYSNGYLTNGTKTNEIVNLVPYEIVLDDEGKCSFELTCPDEIVVSNYVNYDILFTVEIPDGYSIVNGLEIDRLDGYEPYKPDLNLWGLKNNPRYKTIDRNGVTYSSFVRVTSDEDWYHDIESEDHDKNTEDALIDGVEFRLIIQKNNA